MFTNTTVRILVAIIVVSMVSCVDTTSSTAQTANETSKGRTADSTEAINAAKEIITGEHLVTEIPQQWLKIRDSKVANLHVAEYVPPETVDTWTEKLSVEAMQGDDLPDPLVFLNGVAADQSALCDGFANTPIYAGYENGFETVVRLLQCRSSTRTGKPIVSMLKAIRGNQALYTVSRFWRLPTAPADDQPLEMDSQALAEWSNVLKDTYVCDRSTDAHPCVGVSE